MRLIQTVNRIPTRLANFDASILNSYVAGKTNGREEKIEKRGENKFGNVVMGNVQSNNYRLRFRLAVLWAVEKMATISFAS
jgi:hypothetical protein